LAVLHQGGFEVREATRPGFVALFLLLAIVIIYPVTLHSQDARGSKPNIILIVGDDVGWRDLGVYGGGDGRGIATPNFDRLAAEGMTSFSVTGTNQDPDSYW
jgi:Sulfatase